MDKVNFEIEALKENAKTLKVLYVENHAGTRLRLSRFLKHYFEDVFVTTYADNALKIFENGHFNLIITSANLPDMKTCDMCKTIKSIAPKKPIIIVSNNKNPDEIIELINIGISGFILAPLDEKQIIPILSRVVLEITDLEMIYNFQDTIVKELDEDKDLEDFFEELLDEAELENGHDNDLLEDENVELLLTKFEKTSAKKFIENYPIEINSTTDKLLSVIEVIEININKFIRHPSRENASMISTEFSKLAIILDSITEFLNISFSVKKLSMIFETLDDTKNYKEHNEVILAIADELTNWCNSIFINQSTDDIHYLDKSLLIDTLMLENLFRRDANESNNQADTSTDNI